MKIMSIRLLFPSLETANKFRVPRNRSDRYFRPSFRVGAHRTYFEDKALGGAQAGNKCIGSAPFIFYHLMSQIFIGKLIEEELRNQDRSVVWLASKLNCNRTNIYKIFHRASIDTELLLRISNILKRNFFNSYTDRLDI